MISTIRVVSSQELLFKAKRYRCTIGPNGFTDNPREGDKATPLGTYALRECWYRADRVEKPQTSLPLKVIHEDDGWCDDPAHPQYNRHIKLPFTTSHEKLWREEHIYDIIVSVGFNDQPVTPGKGSAIFFHLVRPDYSPTLGCIGISQNDMLEILRQLTLNSQIDINPAL